GPPVISRRPSRSHAPRGNARLAAPRHVSCGGESPSPRLLGTQSVRKCVPTRSVGTRRPQTAATTAGLPLFQDEGWHFIGAALDRGHELGPVVFGVRPPEPVLGFRLLHGDLSLLKFLHRGGGDDRDDVIPSPRAFHLSGGDGERTVFLGKPRGGRILDGVAA